MNHAHRKKKTDALIPPRNLTLQAKLSLYYEGSAYPPGIFGRESGSSVYLTQK